MKHFLDRQQRYGQWNAEELWDRGRRTKAWHLVVRPMLRFFRDYFLRGGFLDGKTGLIVACTAAYTVFVKFATLWEKELHSDKTTSTATTLSLLPRQEQRQAA